MCTGVVHASFQRPKSTFSEVKLLTYETSRQNISSELTVSCMERPCATEGQQAYRLSMKEFLKLNY